MYTIFVGTDFSKAAENATRYAIKLTQKTNGNLILFHECSDIAKCEKRLKEDCKRIEEEYKIACRYIITRMSGAKGLMHKAKQNKADIIIMGATQAPKLEKTLLGSMTQQLIKSGTIPVMAIPEKLKFSNISKLALAIGTVIPNYALLKKLTDFASHFSAMIDIVHVSNGKDKSIAPSTKIDELIKKTGYQNITLTSLKGTDTSKELDNYINKENVSVLVIVRKDLSYTHPFFSGLAGKMIFKSQVPILVFKEEEFNIGPLEIKAEELLG